MDTINGLPAHPLFVHLAVVAIPLAALLGLAALIPRARRRLGVITPIVALVAMIITPLTTSAGESLEAATTDKTAELALHAERGDQMIAWVATLFVVAVLLWALTEPQITNRFPEAVSPTALRISTIVLSVAMVIVAIGTIVMVVLIGDSGAQSVWSPNG